MFRFSLNLLLVLILGLVQLSSVPFIYGLKPNLVLVFVIAASVFSRNSLEKIILVVFGALAIKFHPGFDWYDILFIMSALVGVSLVKYLKSQAIISVSVAVIVATIIINITKLDSFIIIEILMNLIIAWLMYAALKMTYGKNSI